MTSKTDIEYIQDAIDVAMEGMSSNLGGPFGAIVVRDGVIVGRGNNRVTSFKDPTAHAEVVAIRDACRVLNTHQLVGCTIYTSCEPCPMCLGAIYWARPDRVVYACTREDAASAGFDDEFIYKELQRSPAQRQIPTEQRGREEALKVFQKWQSKPDKISY